MIFNQLGYVYLKWFIYTNIFIILVGIITGTIQILKKHNRLILTTIVTMIELLSFISICTVFIVTQNQEYIVYKNNVKMVKETHSFMTSNWINYYDYQNIFIRKKQVRIYEAHNNYIGDLISTTYYDNMGNVIFIEKNSEILDTTK